ncbi:MAG: hypothetical protein ACJATA_001948 [Sphingobacteriales bacterium]|jgi:hypothetical protein
MHEIEPFYNWRDYYVSSEDEASPFYGREYSEFQFSQKIYNYFIHPQWDDFGSPTLYLKIIYADYESGFGVIELIGEWNDCIHNDIMMMRDEVIEPMMAEGLNKFILIGENVLNLHGSDDLYYEEWFDNLGEDGWITGVNFLDHVMEEFKANNIDSYINLGGELHDCSWRNFNPSIFCSFVEEQMTRRLLC